MKPNETGAFDALGSRCLDHHLWTTQSQRQAADYGGPSVQVLHPRDIMRIASSGKGISTAPVRTDLEASVPPFVARAERSGNHFLREEMPCREPGKQFLSLPW